MNSFLRRIQRLQKQLETAAPTMVVLTYGDGSIREMEWMAAFREVGGGADVVAVQCPGDETGESLLAAMLPGIENGAVPWEDYIEELRETE